MGPLLAVVHGPWEVRSRRCRRTPSPTIWQHCLAEKAARKGQGSSCVAAETKDIVVKSSLEDSWLAFFIGASYVSVLSCFLTHPAGFSCRNQQFGRYRVTKKYSMAIVRPL